MRDSEPTAQQKSAESSALRKLWDDKHLRMSQAEFGDKSGIGSQGMVWQYLRGVRPLNLDAAVKFAVGLDCAIDEFSVRLAQVAKRAASVASRAPTPDGGSGQIDEKSARITTATLDAHAGPKRPVQSKAAIAGLVAQMNPRLRATYLKIGEVLLEGAAKPPVESAAFFRTAPPQATRKPKKNPQKA